MSTQPEQPTPPTFPSTRTSARRGVPLVIGLVAGLVVAWFLLASADKTIAFVHRMADVVVDDATCYYAYAPLQQRDEIHPRAALREFLQTDDRGFRVGSDGPLHRDDPASNCRVLAVGDSVTFGAWVKGEEAFPSVLEERLRKDSKVRVYNGAVEGHTILQERVSVLGRWASLAPGVVIVGRSRNDVADLVAAQKLGCQMDAPAPTQFAADLGALHGSHLAGAIEGVRARVSAMSDRVKTVAGNTADYQALVAESGEQAWEQARAEYLRQAEDLARAVQARGGHALFVTLQAMQLRPPGPGEATNRAAGEADFAKALAARVTPFGAALVDVTDALNAQPGLTLEPLDPHPSAAGHQVIASQIASRLGQLGWLSGCR